MISKFQWMFIVLLTLVISACATRTRYEVVAFHENSLPRGETIRVAPVDPDKAGGLEFSHYANLIRDQLQKIGYTPVGPEEEADLIAEIDYSVSSGQTRIRRNDGAYVRYHFYYGRAHRPFYYGLHHDWGPTVYSYTVYERRLQMNIVRSNGEGKVVYEGRAYSVGKERQLTEIMPFLVTAIFANFPGESGITKMITIEQER